MPARKRFSVLLHRTFGEDETDTFYGWTRASDAREAEEKVIKQARKSDGNIYDADEYVPLLTIAGHRPGH